MRYVTVVVLLLLFPTVTLSASLYKWRDSSGVLHITDSEPPSSAKEVSGGTYIKDIPSEYERQQAERQNVYYDQLSQRNYRETQYQRSVSEYNDYVDDRRNHRYEQRKAHLEAKIYQYSRAININDPKKTRDYYRQQRDYYKEQLRLLKKHH